MTGFPELAGLKVLLPTATVGTGHSAVNVAGNSQNCISAQTDLWRFEPKEVIVGTGHQTSHHAYFLTERDQQIRAYWRGLTQTDTAGNILIGQRWPDEVRFILLKNTDLRP